MIQLPDCIQDTGVSLVEAIEQRRSTRSFSDSCITLPELSRILHAAQGITSDRGLRAAPSAGATYPLSIFVVAENVVGLAPGIYRFKPEENTLETVKTGSYLDDLSRAAYGQQCLSSAPLAIAVSADYSITTSVYGDRGTMYVHIEVGHVAQNIYLQCAALELGTVAVGAFTDLLVAGILNLEENETPLYIMPVGRL